MGSISGGVSFTSRQAVVSQGGVLMHNCIIDTVSAITSMPQQDSLRVTSAICPRDIVSRSTHLLHINACSALDFPILTMYWGEELIDWNDAINHALVMQVPDQCL